MNFEFEGSCVENKVNQALHATQSDESTPWFEQSWHKYIVDKVLNETRFELCTLVWFLAFEATKDIIVAFGKSFLIQAHHTYKTGDLHDKIDGKSTRSVQGKGSDSRHIW